MSGLAIQLTPMGEVPVRVDDKGKVIEVLPVPTVELKALPPKFKDKHHNAILAIGTLINQIEDRRRKIPALRDEVIGFGVPKATLNELDSMGFIKNRITPLVDSTTGKRAGSRAIVIPTPLYHAYLRKLQKERQDATN
jgi:hypothetical protein